MPTRQLGLLTLLFASLFAAPALAQADAAAPLAEWSKVLEETSAALAAEDVPDKALPALRKKLEGVRRDTRSWLDEQAPLVADVRKELDALGPAPAEGAEPEAEGVATQRKELKTRLAAAEGVLKEAELLLGRTGRLTGQVSELRRDRFASRLLARGPSPLSPLVWKLALPDLVIGAASLQRATANLLTSPGFRAQLEDSAATIGVTLLIAIGLAWPLRRWLLRRYGRDPAVRKPSFMEVTRATLVVGAARALLPTAAAALIYAAVLAEGLLSDAGEEIAQAALLAFIFLTWTLAFFRASLSPQQPAWRIVPVPTRLARALGVVVAGLAIAFAADIVIAEVITLYGVRLAVTVLRDYVFTVVAAMLVVVLLLRQRMWMPAEEEGGPPRWRSLRAVTAVGLLLLIVMGAFGYVSLARFAVTQLVFSGSLVLLLLVLHRLGREFINQAISTETWLGERLRTMLHVDEYSSERIGFWLGLAYDATLLLVGTVLALFLWGADRQDVSDWFYQFLFGFEIGKVSFSLVDLVVGVLLFGGLLKLTTLIQRTLSERVLPQTSLDPGIRQSIHTGVGYLGIVVAAVVGISAIGLDLSNLAIIAGALSVGIGFGLQNIVNNFVSGLILLVERPVNVGDWVVVGDKQGYVKRIKVRATEIQTFDRASVFVPNSELISSPVTNWTYADKLGRLIIPIGVAYGSDTRKVRDLLRSIGEAHPAVLEEPSPSAMFRGFGDSALNFELRCFLADVEKTVGVTSDLCFAIDDAFREAGIEIPFPQRDLHLKSPAAGTQQENPAAGI